MYLAKPEEIKSMKTNSCKLRLLRNNEWLQKEVQSVAEHIDHVHSYLYKEMLTV